jgi:imidazolonepropionase
LALGLRDRGALQAGLRADFVVWPDVAHPRELAYRFGERPANQVIFGGRARTATA